MLNPLLLWFLPLALVPVILHLITLRRLQTVELGTFRFLMDSYLQQRRRRQLLQWLVMLLRVLFVALIILALARPLVGGLGLFGPGASGRDVTLIVDASPTMDLDTDGTTSLARATAAARTVIQELGPEDHVRIIRAAGRPQVIAQGFARRPADLVAALESITTQAAVADLPAALDYALDADARGTRHGR